MTYTEKINVIDINASAIDFSIIIRPRRVHGLFLNQKSNVINLLIFQKMPELTLLFLYDQSIRSFFLLFQKWNLTLI